MIATFLILLFLQSSGDPKVEARAKLHENPLDPAVENLLQQVLKANPNDAEAHYLYGQWAILNHQESLAVREETRAIALSPDNQLARMQAYTLIGLAEDTLDHEARALAAFQNARLANARLPHPDPRALNEYAAFLLKRARLKDAAQIVHEALRLDPQLGPAHLINARLLERSGNLHAALAEAEQGAAHAADAGEERAARAFLARGYFAAGDTEKALFNQKWIEDHP